uniref:Cleavage and polyadenylation specificity factor subunit 1 n=1 Tax=Tanacetum cinerariifolium TaxID=118510 RepID=A0A699GHS0_TANCI|nr:cleavage and polyadenylation specificity factor subunit 1 [Tanacetum cinerariifolium]
MEYENALTVRVVTLSNTTTRESETLLAVGTAYVQGKDVAARGRVLLFSVENGTEVWLKVELAKMSEFVENCTKLISGGYNLVPWTNERPLENRELNAIIGAWFTLWRD